MTPQYIYVICEQSDGPVPVKIGFSADPDKRLKQLQTGHAAPLTLVYKQEVPSDNVRALERIIHRTLSHKRQRGEWFTLTKDDAIVEVRHAVMRYGDVENLAGRIKARTI